MSTLLYHGFGLVGYDYVRTRYAGGAVIYFQNYYIMEQGIQEPQALSGIIRQFHCGFLMDVMP